MGNRMHRRGNRRSPRISWGYAWCELQATEATRHPLVHQPRAWPTRLSRPTRQSLVEICEQSGGGVTEPPRTVHDCPAHEDNLILGLAAAVGALLIVSDGTDLTAMSPWRGTPVLRPTEFASRVDAMRRARRRR